MITYIRGKIIKILVNSIIVENNGLGYEVYTTTPFIHKNLNNTEPIELYTYLGIREDAWNLYGFPAWEEKELFLNLINVNGVGPKVALNILSNFPLKDLRSAIGSGNSDILVKIPGIGKKIAQRIVVELKEKMQNFVLIENGEVINEIELNNDEVIEALKALGYHSVEIKEIYPRLIRENPNADDTQLIRYALKLLARM